MVTTLNEDRLIRKFRITVIVCILLVITTVFTLCLYFAKAEENKRNYQDIFEKSVTNSIELIDKLMESDFDYETKYREATAELNMCSQMSYFIDTEVENQKTLNQLYSVFVKLPKQAKIYYQDIRDGLQNILNGETAHGYEQISSAIKSMDMQDY